MTEHRVRILIVDDHAALRASLRELISTQTEFEIVGEAGNGEDAVMVAARLQPDVILMDISMPVMDDIEATQLIVARRPETRVIMLTSDASQGRILSALEAGAVGYILKDSEPDQLLRRLRTVST